MGLALFLNLFFFFLFFSQSTLAATRLTHRILKEGELGHAITRHLTSYELHDFSLPESRRNLFSPWGETRRVFELRAFELELTLDLERYDDLYGPNYAHHLVGAAGRLVESLGPLDCVYRATVRGHPTAMGAVSLCADQVHATIHNGGESLPAFTIQPLDIKGSIPDHVVYRHLDVSSPEKHTCGIDDPIKFAVRPSAIPTGGRRALAATKRIESSSDAASAEPLHLHHHLPHSDHRESSAKHLRAATRDLANGVTGKQLGVAVVSDNARYQIYGHDVMRHTLQLFAVVKSLYEAFPTSQPGQIYSINVTVSEMFTWTIEDPYSGLASPVDSSSLLSAFDQWAMTTSYSFPNGINQADVRHLLSGRQFIAPIIGLAYVGSVCVDGTPPPSYSGGKSSIVQANSLSDAQISSTSTHEIGHNLGFQHDGNMTINGKRSGFAAPITNISSCYANAPLNTSPSSTFSESDCYCATPAPGAAMQSIMSATTGSVAHTTWTSCSQSWLVWHLDPTNSLGYGNNGPMCLEAVGAEVAIPLVPVCGNGLIEEGEQCDCIAGVCTDPADTDPCCNSGTTGPGACQLRTGAACSAAQSCCSSSSCQIIANNQSICRPAVDPICDFAERCDGIHADCPTDLFAATGVTCTNPNGYSGNCYQKNCLSLQQVCLNTDTAFAATPCASFGPVCQEVQCQETDYTGCYHTVPSSPVPNGINCGTGMGCFTVNGVAACVPNDQIPSGLFTGPCFDGIKDRNETDVDCGGGNGCFPCSAGQACLVDSDCFPTSCVDNLCTAQSTQPPTSSGVCPTCPSQVQDALTWLADHPQIWGPLLGIVVLCCLAWCFWPTKDTTTGKIGPRLQRSAAFIHGSFHNMRNRPQQAHIPTAEYVDIVVAPR